ncbi:MAG: hypothetical protein P4L46_23855 [Fimbriimonas sp.]|nr:hypothetical protein [Fimbriimonas sp.]
MDGMRSFVRGVLASALAFVATVASATLSIDNFQAADLVRYPVVILRGMAQGPEMAVGTSWPAAIRFPVVNHRYTAIVELKPGANMLLLHSGSESLKFRLDYRPMTGPYKVATVFVMSSDGTERYDSSIPNDRFAIRDKLNVAMKLLQSFTADAMQRAGYGRKTFALDFDDQGRVKVQFLRSPNTTAELQSLDPNSIFNHICGVLNNAFKGDVVKCCGLLGFAAFDPATKKNLGHIALGGGSQALFGAGSMQYWPATFKALPKVFQDASFVDGAKAFEDSGNRHTVWANVSTAYGAMLHELGHTFGLPHSPDRFSIMSRGFDYFSRSLTTVEAPLPDSKTPVAFGPEELAKWDPFFAARLASTAWFQPDGDKGAEFESKDKPTVRFDGDDVIVEAPYGIRVVGAESETVPAWFAEYKEENPPKQAKYSRKEIRGKMQDTKSTYRIVVVDAHGLQADIEDKVGE